MKTASGDDLELGKDRMPLGEKLLFASCDIFGGGGQSILAVLYLIFLTNVLHINPVLAGIVILISKLVDSVIDPLVGVVSDNTRTRIGRRRPYLLAGGVLIFVAIALIWIPFPVGPPAVAAVFVTVTYLFYNIVSSVISVPYSSLSTEISTDFGERNRLNVLRLAVSLVATAVCTLVPTILFASLTSGELSTGAFYLIMVFGFGLVFAVPQVLLGIFGKERAPFDQQRTAFSLKTFVKPFRIAAFRKLLILYICQAITLDIVSAVILYYGLYVVPGLSSTVFLGIFLGVQLLMFPLFNAIINKVSKTKIYRAGIPMAIVGSVGIAFYPSDQPVLGLYVISALTALGFAGAQSMCWLIFPDVIDMSELGLRERITGSFSGVMTLLRKVSSALAIFVVGLCLGLTGFITPSETNKIPQQPDAAIWGIRLIILLAHVVLMGLAYLVARRFRLTPAVSGRVDYFLDKQHEGALDDLVPEDAAEYQALLVEYVGPAQPVSSLSGPERTDG